MLTHEWLEQYRGNPTEHELRQAVQSAVQFDFGDADELPVATGFAATGVMPPFNNCLLQFATPTGKGQTHILVLWLGQSDGSVKLMFSCKSRLDGRWKTLVPRKISRNPDGFTYESPDYTGPISDEIMKAVMCGHAMALNAFYILGCGNVETVDHPAPSFLNKKRARKGKFPILSYKTLVVVTDKPRNAHPDQGGTHSSPRVHLRRGHVRRISESRRIWVQPCVVGSKHGLVVKDYKVMTTAALHHNS